MFFFVKKSYDVQVKILQYDHPIRQLDTAQKFLQE